MSADPAADIAAVAAAMAADLAVAAAGGEPQWFAFNSADPEVKVLSNFYPCAPYVLRVMLPDGTAARFHTVEAAFHSFKARCAKRMSPEDAAVYQQQLSDTKKGLEAKNLGSKKHWTSKGWDLDKVKWDAASRVIMQYLLALRAASDRNFCDMVLKYAAKGPLKHFARFLHYPSAKEPGVIVVKNTTAGINASMLGPDMVDAVIRIRSEGSDEDRRKVLLRSVAAAWTALGVDFDCEEAAVPVAVPASKSPSPSRKRGREEDDADDADDADDTDDADDGEVIDLTASDSESE
jgi:hypothetical protein